MTETSQNQGQRHRLLLLDDDPEALDLYQKLLLELPSHPDVQIATSGARALALLEEQPFTILLSDLKMPRMDGLQVLAIVRRKFPYLRTVVLTGVVDEQLRSRAYAMGIDLYLQKPGNEKELNFFLECIESLLGQEVSGGFRGVQSKSLVDIIQLECLSGSSAVLKVTNGKLEGRVWLQNGEVIDAAAEDQEGEQAFKRILGWRGGNFEILPPDPKHPRRIKTSYQGLLLDSAQSLDEAQALPEPVADAGTPSGEQPASAGFGRIRGIEFALKIPPDGKGSVEHWGSIDDLEKVASWVKTAIKSFDQLGNELKFGPLDTLATSGLQRHMRAVIGADGGIVAAGLVGSPTRAEMNETLSKVLETWGC